MVGYAEEVPALAREIRSGIESVMRSVTRQTDPNEVMGFLRASPFLAEADGFATLPYAGMKYNSVYAYFIRQLTGTGDDQRRALQAALSMRLRDEPQTLGVRLLRAHLSEDPALAIYETLAAARQGIEAGDEKRQRELAFMVADTLGNMKPDRVEAWSEQNRAAHAWLTTLRAGNDRSDAARILKAKNIRTLQIEEYEFDRYVAKTIDAVSESDPKRAKEVLLKALDLVERAAQQGQWYYTPPSGFVDNVFRRGSSSLGLLALAADLVRDVNSPVAPLRTYTLRRHQDAVSRLYRELEDSKQPDRLKQMQKLYQRLGGTFGPGNLSGVTPCFKKVFQSDLTAEELDAITRWAEAESSTGAYPGLAKEIEVHARLRRLGDESADEREPGDPREDVVDSLAPLVAHYQHVLADESLSVPWRLLTLHNLLDWDKRLWNDAMLLQGMSLLARGWQKETSLPEDYLHKLLSQAARLADTSAWRQEVAKVTEAYHAYLRRVARSRRIRSRSPYPTPSKTYDQRVQLALLEMNLRCDDTDSIKQLVREQGLATDLDAWALLVEHGQSDHARTFMRTGWQEVDRSSSHPYTAAFEAKLSACLAEITEADLRYYGELLLSALADGPAEDPPSRTREERLVDLAERFAEVSFSNEGVKQRALLVLAGSDQALAQVGDALAVAAQGIDLGAVCSLSLESEREVKSSLVLAYAAEALKRGDASVFLSGIESVVALREKASSRRGYEHEKMLEKMAKHLRQFGDTLESDWTPELMEAMASLSARLVGTSSRYYTQQERARLWDYCVLFHVLAGREDQLDSASAQISDDLERQFRYYRDVEATFKAFASLTGHQKRKQKIATVRRYFALGQVKKRFNQHNTREGPIFCLWEYGVLTEKEILAQGAKLVGLAKPVHRNWENIAKIQAKHDLIEEAEASWLRSIEGCTKKSQVWPQRLGYCAFLKEQGRAEQALRYVQGIETEDWPAKMKDERRAWLAKTQADASAKKGK